jgi:hypothetical protein
MIDFNDKKEVVTYIDKLQENMTPLFGALTPQHVLEHLRTSLFLSMGRLTIEFKGTPEMAEKIKAGLIYTDAPLPQGIKNPILPDTPPPLVFPDIETARMELKKELDTFYAYKENNPDVKHVHPRMNLLSLDEWTLMHSKHFTHHFKQYGLV